jgi:Na+/H+ antiporter NhaC
LHLHTQFAAVRKVAGKLLLQYTKGVPVFLILFIILLVMWLLGFAAFHVAGGLIHLLLIVAVISLVLHLFQGRRAV